MVAKSAMLDPNNCRSQEVIGEGDLLAAEGERTGEEGKRKKRG